MSDDPRIGFLKADMARFCAGPDEPAPAIRKITGFAGKADAADGAELREGRPVRLSRIRSGMLLCPASVYPM
ncbi:hypothetical protein [Streptomyces sp. NBC_01314]|uniref:hypothetical protein n=1 Tax=Streptomyces sp. NBC_01314 TaxID=2903821 RepID=UPI0030933F87|nr:hypothetical protein OG622_12210 [Streptomyces sp. NBC_01314]